MIIEYEKSNQNVSDAERGPHKDYHLTPSLFIDCLY